MDMPQSNEFQFEDRILWEDLGNGIQRQVYGYDDKIMMVKAKFEEGAIGAMHSHPHSQVTYVRGGKFDATIGDKSMIIKDGDGFYVPPNVMHGVICLEAGMLVDAFSPLRDDFL